MRRPLLLLPMVALVLAVSACGSPSVPPSTTAHSTATSATTAVARADPPAVTGATDLSHEPVVGPGSSPAPTSLQTKDLVVGTGAVATAADTVKVQYVGTDYTDGKVFDSSWSRGMAAVFPLNEVVPGFAQGIVGMKVGGRREIVIPSNLGYGAAGNPPAVGPDETIVFVVDLLAID